MSASRDLRATGRPPRVPRGGWSVAEAIALDQMWAATSVGDQDRYLYWRSLYRKLIRS